MGRTPGAVKKLLDWLKSNGLDASPGRLASDPWTFTGTIKIPDGLLLSTSKGTQSGRHRPIKIQMKITRAELERLFCFSQADPGDFFLSLLKGFLTPAFVAAEATRGPGGKHAGHETTLLWLKAEACDVYHLFLYLINAKKAPPFFKAFVDSALKLENSDQFYRVQNGKRVLDPIALTACYVDSSLKHRGITPEELGIKPFGERIDEGETSFFDTFYKHYIHGTKPSVAYDDLSDEDALKLIQMPPFEFLQTFLPRTSTATPEAVSEIDEEPSTVSTEDGILSVTQKKLLVLRSIRGESFSSIAEQSGVPKADLVKLKMLFIKGGESALKTPELFEDTPSKPPEEKTVIDIPKPKPIRRRSPRS